MDQLPKLELFIYLPGGRTETVLLPAHLAAELCPDKDWPAFPSFPLRMALSTARESGCGTSVVYERQKPEADSVDPVPGVQGAEPKRDRRRRSAPRE